MFPVSNDSAKCLHFRLGKCSAYDCLTWNPTPSLNCWAVDGCVVSPTSQSSPISCSDRSLLPRNSRHYRIAQIWLQPISWEYSQLVNVVLLWIHAHPRFWLRREYWPYLWFVAMRWYVWSGLAQAGQASGHEQSWPRYCAVNYLCGTYTFAKCIGRNMTTGLPIHLSASLPGKLPTQRAAVTIEAGRKTLVTFTLLWSMLWSVACRGFLLRHQCIWSNVHEHTAELCRRKLVRLRGRHTAAFVWFHVRFGNGMSGAGGRVSRHRTGRPCFEFEFVEHQIHFPFLKHAFRTPNTSTIATAGQQISTLNLFDHCSVRNSWSAPDAYLVKQQNKVQCEPTF